MQNLGCCKLHQHAHLAHLGATCMDGTGLRQVVKYPRPETDDEWGVAIYMGFRQGECRVQGETLIPRCTCESEFGNRCACIFATSVAPMPKLEESPQRTAPRRGAARAGMGVGEKTKPEARAGRKESVIVASAYRIRPAERPLARARWTRKLSAVRAAQVRMAGASDRMAGAEARRPACSTMAGARRGLEEPEDISFAHLS